MVDLDILQQAECTLEEYVQSHGHRLTPARRAQIVAVLYDYTERGGTKEGILKALQALVA